MSDEHDEWIAMNSPQDIEGELPASWSSHATAITINNPQMIPFKPHADITTHEFSVVLGVMGIVFSAELLKGLPESVLRHFEFPVA